MILCKDCKHWLKPKLNKAGTGKIEYNPCFIKKIETRIDDYCKQAEPKEEK